MRRDISVYREFYNILLDDFIKKVWGGENNLVCNRNSKAVWMRINKDTKQYFAQELIKNSSSTNPAYFWHKSTSVASGGIHLNDIAMVNAILFIDPSLQSSVSNWAKLDYSDKAEALFYLFEKKHLSKNEPTDEKPDLDFNDNLFKPYKEVIIQFFENIKSKNYSIAWNLLDQHYREIRWQNDLQLFSYHFRRNIENLHFIHYQKYKTVVCEVYFEERFDENPFKLFREYQKIVKSKKISKNEFSKILDEYVAVGGLDLFSCFNDVFEDAFAYISQAIHDMENTIYEKNDSFMLRKICKVEVLPSVMENILKISLFQPIVVKALLR